MTEPDLVRRYRAYLDCLNRQGWDQLDEFVDEHVRHNDRPLGLGGYRAMLEEDFAAIPDLRFVAERLVCEPPHVAARLWFDCAPAGRFLDLPIDGRRIAFAEHVFYRFEAGRIVEVRSVLDKAAIEAQLAG